MVTEQRYNEVLELVKDYENQLKEIEEKLKKDNLFILTKLLELESKEQNLGKLEVLTGFFVDGNFEVSEEVYEKIDRLKKLEIYQQLKYPYKQLCKQPYNIETLLKEVKTELNYDNGMANIHLEFAPNKIEIYLNKKFDENDEDFIIKYYIKIDLNLKQIEFTAEGTEEIIDFINSQYNLKKILESRNEAISKDISGIFGSGGIGDLEKIDEVEEWRLKEDIEYIEENLKESLQSINSNTKENIVEIREKLEETTFNLNDFQSSSLAIYDLLLNFANQNRFLLISDINYPTPENQLNLFESDNEEIDDKDFF